MKQPTTVTALQHAAVDDPRKLRFNVFGSMPLRRASASGDGVGADAGRRLLCGAALGLLCGAPAPALAARAGAPALLLAREWLVDADPAGFLVSEKFDGVRALWDGRGLCFRSGRPIAAPAWFTARLPAQALDGELWLGRGRFEATSGGVRRDQPDGAFWSALRYQVFELPGAGGVFADRSAALAALCAQTGWPALQAAPQRPVANRAALQQQLEAVVAAGGEGLVLHRADAPQAVGRGPWLWKHKPLHDAEAVVLAHLPGQGRFAGQLGALQVKSEAGVEFSIGTGFSDADRQRPPALGQRISYTHRGYTADGVPRFASYLRLASAHF
jgi:DNA ligase-1